MSANDEQNLLDFLYDVESDPDDDDYDPANEDDVLNDIEEEDEFDADSLPSEYSEPPMATTSTHRTSSFTGKNGHQWSSEPHVRQGRSAAPSFKLYVPAARGPAASVKTTLETWNCLFDDEIIDQIYRYTQAEISDKLARISKKQSYHRDTSLTEIRAVIGLLYLAGSMKSGNVDLDELWSDRYGVSIFRAVMSKHRFAFLLSCFHFDD